MKVTYFTCICLIYCECVVIIHQNWGFNLDQYKPWNVYNMFFLYQFKKALVSRKPDWGTSVRSHQGVVFPQRMEVLWCYHPGAVLKQCRFSCEFCVTSLTQHKLWGEFRKGTDMNQNQFLVLLILYFSKLLKRQHVHFSWIQDGCSLIYNKRLVKP